MKASEMHTRPDDDRAPKRAKRLMAAGETEDNTCNPYLPDESPEEPEDEEWGDYVERNADTISKGL